LFEGIQIFIVVLEVVEKEVVEDIPVVVGDTTFVVVGDTTLVVADWQLPLAQIEITIIPPITTKPTMMMRAMRHCFDRILDAKLFA
jgi:hypothetical protein